MVIKKHHIPILLVGCVLFGAFALAIVPWSIRSERGSIRTLEGVITLGDLEELKSALRTGVSTQEVLNVLGKPLDKNQGLESSESWVYTFSSRFRQKMADEDLWGVKVWITNGCVAAWDFIYWVRHMRKYDNGVSHQDRANLALVEGTEPPELCFHVMRDGGVGVTEDLQTMISDGSWHKNCESEFRIRAVSRVESLQSKGARGRVEWGIALRLCAQDIERFGTFTGQYVGQTVVVTLDGQVIAMPTLVTPIRNGELEFGHLKTEDVGQTLMKLKRLEKGSPAR